MFKYLLSALVIIAITTLLFAGEETKTFSNKDFSGVSICCGMKLRLNKGNNYSIKVTADQKDLQYLSVEQKDNSLNFYINKNNYHLKNDIHIEITMPDLKDLSLSGGANANINMNTDSDFKADLSGGAVLVGNLNCSNTELQLSGGSNVKIKGRGKDIDLSGSGGSTFEMKDFAVNDVECNLSGGSEVKIKMDGTLNTSQSGGSQFIYYGTSKIGRTSFSGGSGVSKGD